MKEPGFRKTNVTCSSSYMKASIMRIENRIVVREAGYSRGETHRQVSKGDQHISREEEQFLMSYNTAAYFMCYEES